MNFLLALILFLFSDLATEAHIINRDLEQGYTTVYLQIYLTDKLLPFLGLGLLANTSEKKVALLDIQWVLTGVLLVGLITGTQLHEHYHVEMANHIGMIITGSLLLFKIQANHKLINVILYSFGFSVGLEFGNMLINMQDFYVHVGLSFLLGLTILTILKNLYFDHRFLINLARSFGLLLILAGIILILLS